MDHAQTSDLSTHMTQDTIDVSDPFYIFDPYDPNLTHYKPSDPLDSDFDLYSVFG